MALAGLIAAGSCEIKQSNREAMAPDRTVALAFSPRADVSISGPARLAGAWDLAAPDPRFGGLSALGTDGGKLLAVSDSAVAVWLDLPGAAKPAARLHSIAETAGDPTRKIGRDSEGLAADPLGRGWWLSYEQVHSLILYDRHFAHALKRIPLASPDFKPNKGVEAIWPDGRRIAWLAEASGVSDAARLPDGRVALLHRDKSAEGIESWITGLGAPIALHLGPLDNPEGITAATLPDGGTRLWVITDNDLKRYRPTLLLAIDLPPKG